MDKIYKIWAIMNTENDVISIKEHSEPKEAIQEMLDLGWTKEEMIEAGLTLNQMLCAEISYFACLEEIPISEAFEEVL